MWDELIIISVHGEKERKEIVKNKWRERRRRWWRLSFCEVDLMITDTEHNHPPQMMPSDPSREMWSDYVLFSWSYRFCFWHWPRSSFSFSFPQFIWWEIVRLSFSSFFRWVAPRETSLQRKRLLVISFLTSVSFVREGGPFSCVSYRVRKCSLSLSMVWF